VLVRHVCSGPFELLAKEELPAQLCAFTHGVMRAEAARPPGFYDVIHSHYWLSGQVGWLAKQRWGVPLVHTAHTLAKVKNALLAAGDRPERGPGHRRAAGGRRCGRLARTLQRGATADLCAEHNRVAVVEPGVDQAFVPPPVLPARPPRAPPGPADPRSIVAFVGRISRSRLPMCCCGRPPSCAAGPPRWPIG
jgi:D-inositol-3-phosphate glycosyltransferase